MSEMIERVARAIYETWAQRTGLGESWDEIVRLNHSFVGLAHAEARAAIEAMREPTAAMIDAAYEVQSGERMPEVTWDVMIVAAINLLPE
jgi:hypothetical protein